MRIFVGGAQRSGTSLMRSIIGSHSGVAFFPYDVKLWTKYSKEFESWDFRDSNRVAQAVDIILADEKVVIADVVPDRDVVIAKIQSVPGGEVTPATIFDAFLRSYADVRGREIYGLKTPWNEFHAAGILEAFDDAVFVHVIRDPRKSALSAIFVDGGSWFYDPLLHLKRWKRSATLALENQERYGKRYHVVRYEDLAGDPRTVAAGLMSAIGLIYEEGMEKGDKQPGWSGTNTSFASSGRSESPRRRELPVGLRFLYESKLSTELSAWGYSVEKQTPLRVGLALPGLWVRLLGIFLLHRGIELKSAVAKMGARLRPSKPLRAA